MAALLRRVRLGRAPFPDPSATGRVGGEKLGETSGCHAASLGTLEHRGDRRCSDSPQVEISATFRPQGGPKGATLRADASCHPRGFWWCLFVGSSPIVGAAIQRTAAR